MFDFIKDLFSKKHQNIEHAIITHSVIIQTGGDIVLDTELSQLLELHKNEKLFINQTVKEKLEHCVKLILDGKHKEASLIIDTIYMASLKSISTLNADWLSLVKIIICLLEDNIEQAISLIPLVENNTIYQRNIKMAINIRRDDIINLAPTDMFADDHLFLYTILQMLFFTSKWDYIINYFKPTEHSLHFQHYFYGLACLNNQNFTESIQALEVANAKRSLPKYVFCRTISQINLSLSQIRENDLDYKALESEIQELDASGNLCPELRDANLATYNLTRLRALLALRSTNFLKEYSNLPQEQKNDINFRFQLGSYYQSRKEYNEAIRIYNEILAEDTSSELSHCIMLCYLLQNEFAEIVYCFGLPSTHKIPSTITIYLIAIHNQASNQFDDLFDKYFYTECIKVDDLSFFLELYTYSKHARDALYTKTLELREQIIASSKVQKIMFAFFVAEMSDIELSKCLLSNVSTFTSNDLEAAYFHLSHLTNIEIRTVVAQWFIDNDLKTPQILNILAECYMGREKYSSAFPLLKESFTLKHEKRVAVSLINLAAIIESVRINDVQEYLDFVATDNEPQVLLIVAQTYCKFGFYDNAEKLSYKAIFLLNNHNDDYLFNLYLTIHFKMIGNVSEKNIEFDRVVDNTVITLVPHLQEQNSEITSLIICINQEAEFCNDINSIGALHISKSNLLYLKLINKKKHDTIDYNGLSYKIESVIDKYVYTFRYILPKVDDSKDYPLIKKISVDMNKDIKQQMQEVLRELGPNNNLLDLYYFKDSPTGLPIECINHGGYDDYVQIVQLLLYSKDGAFYAGLNKIKFNASQDYTITLSTLVILKVLDNLSLLEQYLRNIYISDTLLDFFKKRSENASKTLAVSPGKLGLGEDDSLIMTPPDSSMPDFWNSIYETALKFNMCSISSADRSDFNKQHSDIDLEEIFAKTKIHICQWDSFIIAQKHNATLLSDDLFFRRLGDFLSIQNVNHTHLYNNMRFENIESAFIKLLETNYLYIPTIATGDLYISKYINSITSNERKRRAYAEIFPPDSLLRALWSL